MDEQDVTECYHPTVVEAFAEAWDMIERVARALCDGNWDAASFNETANGEEPEEQREYWREKALAAIEAMREPSFDMVEAGQQVNNLLPEDRDPTNAFLFLSRDEMTEAWQAMIDAALVPSPPLGEE